MQLISLRFRNYLHINVLYRPGGPFDIKSIWNGLNKIALLIMHLKPDQDRVPGDDGRDQSEGG